MKTEVYLSGKEFARLGLSDTFRHQRSRARPALFTAILSGSAAVCFTR